MSSWAGWVADMIGALGIPDTTDNADFLKAWATYSPNPCRNNPLGAVYKGTGSTDCKITTGGAWIQAYASQQSGLNQTKRQLADSIFYDLRSALDSGHPYKYPDMHNVIADLQLWGATEFARQVSAQSGAGGLGTVSGNPAHVSQAWSRWMHALAHGGPESHNRIRKATGRARRIAR